MTIFYVIAGIGVLLSIVALGVYIHRAAKTSGKLEATNECDKRIMAIKSELARKIYGDGLSHFPINQPDGMWHKTDDPNSTAKT